MDWLSSLLTWGNAVYLLPLAGLIVFAGLQRVGLDIDVLGAVETDADDERAQRRLRWLFPNRELQGLSAALLIGGWAATGLVCNMELNEDAGFLARLVVFVVALLIGWSVSLVGSKAVDKALPSASDGPTLAELVGMQATVISEPSDGGKGRARVALPDGSSITVFCRNIADGSLPRPGELITLAGYDDKAKTFDVFA